MVEQMGLGTSNFIVSFHLSTATFISAINGEHNVFLSFFSSPLQPTSAGQNHSYINSVSNKKSNVSCLKQLPYKMQLPIL